ncbi:MAG: glycine--tRNA ligase [Chlorobi bacterium]|nr:glycine--tRNA ligase [Chlorobiota bacterium]
MKNDLMAQIVSLSKRRGFIFQSSEIYGGLNGCWDYGPLGVELLNNIKQAWWQSMTFRDDIEGLDASILMHPKVWEASGHVENFTDPMVDCKECKARFRADQIDESKCGSNAYKGRKASKCRDEGKFTEARQFNLMFKTFIGAVESEDAVVYLRPETAQGIFVNFNNVKDSTRQKLPFGIAQIGKAFRNEINTKNFLYRTREFEQMEMQYFVKQGIDTEKYEYWKQNRLNWWINYGIRKERLQFVPHPQSKLAHYAKDAVDIEFDFPFGWGEIEGIHNRSDFDLSQHVKFSGKKLEYYDDETKERYIPYVIETSAGASRGFMAFLCNAYDEDEAPTALGKVEKRTVLRFHPKLAPIKCAVFPLVNKDGLQEVSHGIKDDLQSSFNVFYDESGAVGRRYRRQDECGTPYCVTVDYDTLKDNTVTIRDRDSMKQERIHKDLIKKYILEKLF